jgi:transcriptional regulator with XRE-family HTH domain
VLNLKLKIACLEAGIEEREIAARLGKHKTQFSKAMHGVRRFTAEDRQKIAKILRRPERELFPDAT